MLVLFSSQQIYKQNPICKFFFFLCGGCKVGVSFGDKDKVTVIDVNIVYSAGLVSEFAFLPDLLLFRFECENF